MITHANDNYTFVVLGRVMLTSLTPNFSKTYLLFNMCNVLEKQPFCIPSSGCLKCTGVEKQHFESAITQPDMSVNDESLISHTLTGLQKFYFPENKHLIRIKLLELDFLFTSLNCVQQRSRKLNIFHSSISHPCSWLSTVNSGQVVSPSQG